MIRQVIIIDTGNVFMGVFMMERATIVKRLTEVLHICPDHNG